MSDAGSLNTPSVNAEPAPHADHPPARASRSRMQRPSPASSSDEIDKDDDVDPDISTRPFKRRRESPSAPSHDIGTDQFVALEHPGIVKNVDKGLASLGGYDRIQEFLSSDASDKQLGLYLQPEERLRRPLTAEHIHKSDLLVRITVPRRTGRRRKRGSNGPWEHDPRAGQDDDQVKTLLRSLQDNPKSSDFEVLGEVKDCYSFAGLPDLQWSLATSRMSKRLSESIPNMGNSFAPSSFPLLPRTFPGIENPERLKPLPIDIHKYGRRPGTELLPPPVMLLEDTPWDYQYAQAGVRMTQNDGTSNRTSRKIARSHVYTLDNRAKRIPKHPRPDLPPEASLDPQVRQVMEKSRALLNEAPIWTRRQMLNRLPDGAAWHLRYGLQYLVYQFKSGPWKDTYIRLGYDPRQDPESRAFQTITVRLPSRHVEVKKARNEMNTTGKRIDRESHVFDGKSIGYDGSTWTLCDMMDPLLKSIVDQAVPRNVCDVMHDGWLQNCTMGKVRTVARDKILHILEGREPPQDSLYKRVIDLPESLEDQELEEIMQGVSTTPHENQLFSTLRDWLRREKYDLVLKKRANGGTDIDYEANKDRRDGVIDDAAVDEDRLSEEDEENEEDEHDFADENSDSDVSKANEGDETEGIGEGEDSSIPDAERKDDEPDDANDDDVI